MFIDPITLLLARKQAQKNNLDSSAAFKAALLGAAVGGGDVATSIFFTDHLIKKKAKEKKKITVTPPDPRTCLDNLLSEFEIFISCVKADENNTGKLEEYKKAFEKIVRGFVGIDAEHLNAATRRLKHICATPQKPV